MFDHGEEGFRSTCRALASREILFAGAGARVDEASRPLVLDCDGVRVGVIACAEATTQAQMATSESSGCNPLRFPHMAEQVSSVRAQAGVVVVVPHWGMCDYAYPPVDVVFHGERLLDAGADIVIGHHSHIPQGMRRRKDGKAIVYSLGDLFFDTYQAGNRKIAPTEENRKGLLLILELVEGKIASILPVFTRHCGTVVHEDTRAEREHELADRSGPLKWVECYPAHWRAVVRERLIRRVGFWANPAHWRYIRPATMQAALIMGRESLLRRFHRTERAGRYG